MAPEIKDAFRIGSRCCIANDSDLRGNITIGSGTILHPRCTILAMSGPITLGSGCIVEENAVILNRSKSAMVIGDNNHFQVGCRVESLSVGSNNSFGIWCRVAHTVSIGSDSSIGSGCIVLPSPFPSFAPPTPPPDVVNDSESSNDESTKAAVQSLEVLPDRTVIYGSESRRRLWDLEGVGQRKALHAKHLVYLSETMPKSHKLKVIAPAA